MFVRPLQRIARYSTATALESNLDTRKTTLPSLPSKASGWPTPWVTLEEMHNYLTPIQETAYWQIPDHWPSLSLRRSFWFTSGPSALRYMRDIIDIANAERHHPSLLRYQDTPSPQVDVLINTHSAIASPKLFAEVFPSAFRDKVDPIPLPGITIRDVRFAILVYEKFMDTYVAQSKGIDAPIQQPFLKDPRSLIKQAHKLAGFCPACAGQHSLSQCEVRKQISPNVPCGVCGEAHWHIDCPQKKSRSTTPAAPL